MSKKVVTFGEIMLRLAPEGYYRFVQADKFGATYGGGEANVAVSLANYGYDAKFVTKLPKHEIGQAAVNSLRKYGVDTSYIARGGDRVGIYFLEKGASQRPSKVIYDRAGSSIYTASASDFNWDEIFDGAEWFHFTGITPALNDNVAAICLEACKAAKAKGVTVSCDLNYRNKLWSKEKAGQVMGELCKYVDVCIANEEDAGDVFGIRSEGTDVTAGEVNHEGYGDLFKEAVDGILQYRDGKTGLFYQVIDHADTKGNYTETSGSAMVAYAVMKGARLEVLSREKYAAAGIGIFDSLVREKLVPKENGFELKDICWVAGLGPGEKRDGSVEYYLSEKIVSDDSKGVGPFMMAYAQKLMLEKCL